MKITVRKNKGMQKNRIKSLAGGTKVLIIFIAAFVTAALIFGIVFSIIAAVRRESAAVEFSGVMIDEPTAAYFVSLYKYRYIAELRAADIEAYDSVDFWATVDADGVSYGSRLILGVRNFISDILVANYYFDRYGKLDTNDKEELDEIYESVISRFTSERLEAALLGAATNERSLKRAIEMYYKATCAKTEIYGTSGATLMGYPDECNKYLNEYSRVKLLFIRTKDTFSIDENGDRIIENGEYLMRDLYDYELAERAELIAKIDAEIEGYEQKEDIQITEDIFEGYIDTYGEGEDDKTKSGYYFAASADYTGAFAEDVSADIVRSALEMQIGEYRKVDVGFATCYIYKCPVESGVYTDTSEEGFFADFYSDAADFLFAEMLEDMREDTVFYGKLTEEDIIEISYDSDLYVRF